MEKQQAKIDKNVDMAILTNIRQNNVSSEMVPKQIIRALGWLLRSLYAEIESLRSLIKEHKEELLKKDLSISFLKKDREILIDENERTEKEFENYKAERWQYEKRKLLLLR